MQKPWKPVVYIIGGAIGIWLTAKLLLPVGLPFLLGLVIARLSMPSAHWLQKKWHFPHGVASFAAVSLISLLLLTVLWVIGRGTIAGAEAAVSRLPKLLSSLQEPLSDLQTALLHLTTRLPPSFSAAGAQWITRLFEGGSVLADTVSGWLMGFAGTVLSFVPELVLFVLTMLLSAYLFSSGSTDLKRLARGRLPASWLQKLRSVYHRLKTAIGGYCKAQLLLMLVTFGILLLGFLLLRRSSALLLAALIAVIDALPVFGVGSVLLPWAAIAFLQKNTSLGIGLLSLYASASLTRTVLEPRFLGRQIGMHPLLTLLSLYAGFRLFGIVGMILVPICVILLKQLYDLAEAV